MDEFKNNIQRWVELDNRIKQKNDEIKELRLHKQQLHNDIIKYVDDNNMQTTTINVGDGNLKFGKQKQIQPLTLKYVQSCLEDMIVSHEHVSQIMYHIKSSRHVTVSDNIRRCIK